jgi:hypothetical protein
MKTKIGGDTPGRLAVAVRPAVRQPLGIRIQRSTVHQLEYYRPATVTNPTKNEQSPPLALPQCWLLKVFPALVFAVMHVTVGMSSPDSFSDPATLDPEPRPSRVGAQRYRWALLYYGDASGQSRHRPGQLRRMCDIVARAEGAHCNACHATFDNE